MTPTLTPARFVRLSARTAPAATASARIRGARQAALAAGLCVLLVHGAARAQQPEAVPEQPAPPAEQPAAPAQPAQPATPPQSPQPPPNYPPPLPVYPPGTYGAPPPGGGYYYPQSYYPAQQPQRGQYRPFTLGLGLGVGTLSFRDEFGVRGGEPGLSYTLRVGFGVTRTWLVFLGAEGTGVSHGDTGIWQTAYVLGAQCFVFHRLYLRAGIGLASATIQDSQVTGQSLMGAAGFEFAQGYSTSLAIELTFAGARYPGETWSNGGLNFVLNFF